MRQRLVPGGRRPSNLPSLMARIMLRRSMPLMACALLSVNAPRYRVSITSGVVFMLGSEFLRLAHIFCIHVVNRLTVRPLTPRQGMLEHRDQAHPEPLAKLPYPWGQSSFTFVEGHAASAKICVPFVVSEKPYSV